jgi:maltose O-acetyltransferase
MTKGARLALRSYKDVGNWLLGILPSSRLFGLKRSILRAIGVEVEAGVSVNSDVKFYGRGRVRIGRNTWIGPGCEFHSVAGTVIDIGSDVDVAPGVWFVCGSHKVGPPGRRAGPGVAADIVVQQGSWIGARSTLLGTANVGRGCIVGAGSLVRDGVEADHVAVGVPARAIRKLDD